MYENMIPESLPNAQHAEMFILLIFRSYQTLFGHLMTCLLIVTKQRDFKLHLHLVSLAFIKWMVLTKMQRSCHDLSASVISSHRKTSCQHGGERNLNQITARYETSRRSATLRLLTGIIKGGV